MDRKRIEKLIASHEKSADRQYRNYQDSGNGRYYTAYKRHEEIVEALRIALDAAEEHNKYNFMRADLAMLAEKAKRTLCRHKESDPESCSMMNDVVAVAAAYGLTSGRFDQ